MKKLLFLLFMSGVIVSCNNESTDTNANDTASTVQPDTMVHDNTINMDTAPALTIPSADTTLKRDTLKK